MPNLSQRIRTVTYDEAVDACSSLGLMVYRDLGLTGQDALTLEREMYLALGNVLVNMNAESRAVEYVQQREISVSRPLENIKTADDLFDPIPLPVTAGGIPAIPAGQVYHSLKIKVGGAS